MASYLSEDEVFGTKAEPSKGNVYLNEDDVFGRSKKTVAPVAPKITTVENPLSAKEPGIIDRAVTAIKGLVTDSDSGSVMDQVAVSKPTPDIRLELGQGPISEETLRKARDVREGITKAEKQPALIQRTAEALAAKKEPTFRGLVDQAMESERIVEQAEAQRKAEQERRNPTLTSISDFSKYYNGAIAGSTLSIPFGLETGAEGAIRNVVSGEAFDATPVGKVFNLARSAFNDVLGIQSIQEQAQDKRAAQITIDRAMSSLPSIPGVQELATYGDTIKKDLQESVSEKSKSRLADTEITGNIFKGELSFGENPNLYGYALQAAGVLGSLAPIVVTAIATRGNATAIETVGFGMGAAEGADTAKEYISKLTDEQLFNVSPYYKAMVDRGVPVKEARQIVTDKAAENAAMLQGMIAAVGGRITGNLVTGAYDDILSRVGGKSLAGRVTAGIAGSALEEGVQEVGEGLGADIGIRSQITNKEIGEGSAANLILGALGGAGPGGVRGAVSRTPEQEIADIINANVANMQPVGTREAAVAALSPEFADSNALAQGILRSATVDDAIAAADQAAGSITTPSFVPPAIAPAPFAAPAITPAEPIIPIAPVAEIQQPATNLGRIEPTLPPVTEPTPVTPTEIRSDLPLLAPRPQRIQGQPVANLTDDQLSRVVEDQTLPAITRRGAQVELDARRTEQRTGRVEPTLEPFAPPAAEPVGGRVEPTLEPFAPPGAPAAPLPTAAAEPVAGAIDTSAIRADAQRYVDEQAAAEGRESPVQLNPAPAAEQKAVQDIAQALGSQFGTTIEAYSDPRDVAVNGFAHKGVAFVNVANVPIDITRTSLHEFKHTVEQIAQAETQAGLTGTPAQQFVADIDSIFDDITEEGRQAYVENFLFAEELKGLTGTKRQRRLRQLMASPTLRSEMTADFLGNRATDKAFWQDIAAQDPEGFKGFVEKWLKIVDELLATLRGTKTQGQKESAKVDKYIRDLNVAKMVARDALINYRRGTLAQTEKAAAAGKPAASLREGEGREENIPARGEGVLPSTEGAGPSAGELGRGEIPSYGKGREGAVSVIGRHYSPRVQTSLSGRYYGTGIRGAEGSRIRESKDRRIGDRIYFYVDTGSGIRPESGVGRFAHEVRLNNIYDTSTGLIPPQGSSNDFESAVIDAGFDGYIAPFGRGAAVVLLGPKHGAVPVKPLEPGAAFSKRTKTTSIGDYETVSQKDGGIMVMGDAEEIRGLMPEGVVGRPVENGVLFTPANAPRVRAALEGRKLAYSRAGAVITKLPMKDGKYVGAPPKYNTPGKIAALRKSLRKLTQEGAPGRYWYENSSRAILRMVGGNVQEARKFVALLAIYSPQAKVDANSTFALRAWAQYKAGLPISVKTGVMDSKAKAAMDDVDEYWSGEKTGNFFNNLLREIDPSTAGKQGATIDMWMMRAAEYPTDAPNPNQYSFMENETNAIAKELGWEPQQVQAAIWVAMKARMENSGVKKATEASSEKKGWIRYDYPLKNGKPFKTRVIIDAQAHRDNWLAHAFRHDPSKEDTQLAKFDFEDGVMRHLGQVSFEARPGRSTGVLPGIHNAPYAQQVEFQQAVQAAFLDDTGADRLAQMLGLLVDTNNILAPGVWQGEVSPSSQKLVAMAPSKGEEGKTSVDPAQAEALNLYASVSGLVARQEGVGWHRPFFASTKRDANALDIDLGRVINPAEAADLERAIGVWMENNEKADWQDSFAIISSPKGVRLVNFGVVSNAVMQSDIVQAAESALPDFDYRVFASSGDMPTNNWKENPNGESYVQRLSAAGRSDVLDWARTVLAPRVQSVFEEYSKKYDWGNPGEISFSARQDEGRVRETAREVQEVTPSDLESIFERLNGRGLKRTRARAAVDARPDAARIKYVQDNFLDILSELEDSGKVKINCD